MTRRAWGKVLIDGGVVRSIAPMFHEWTGRSADRLQLHYASARFERL